MARRSIFNCDNLLHFVLMWLCLTLSYPSIKFLGSFFDWPPHFQVFMYCISGWVWHGIYTYIHGWDKQHCFAPETTEDEDEEEN